MPAVVGKKIGFALGGGGARGLSHIGVLKVFDEHGISPDIIAGTSIGAIIGALYAGGYKAKEIERIVLGLDWKKLVNLIDLGLPISGLLKGKKVVSLLRSIIGDLTFPQLECAFSCVATDIINGEQVVLREGSLIEAVRASISIPGVFTPVSIMGRYLVDGGLTNTVSVSVCREMGAEYVVGINVIPEPGRVMCNPKRNQQYPVCELPDLAETGIHDRSLQSHIDDIEKTTTMFILSHGPEGGKKTSNSLPLLGTKITPRLRDKSPKLIDVLSQTLTITEYRVALENLKEADLAINPNVEEIGFWQFNNAVQAIAAGEYAASISLERKDLAVPLG
jgi:NTE family protein